MCDSQAFLPSNVAGEAFEMLDVGQRGKVSQHVRFIPFRLHCWCVPTCWGPFVFAGSSIYGTLAAALVEHKHIHGVQDHGANELTVAVTP